MSKGYSIRRAGLADASALAALKRQTFRQTFVDGPLDMGYSEENLTQFEAENYSEQAVTAQLRDPLRVQWVVEAADNMLVAYAHAGPCKLPHEEAKPHYGELYQLYVANSCQRMGIGGLLLDTVLGWLAEAMPGPVWLGVFSGNHRAQAMYAARGFAKVGEYQFKVGDHRDHEFIFRRD